MTTVMVVLLSLLDTGLGSRLAHETNASNYALFTLSSTSAPVPFEVNPFTKIAATSYLWDFGNGAQSQDAAPTHVYTKPGRYVITLKVTSGTQQQQFSQAVYAQTPPNADGSLTLEPGGSVVGVGGVMVTAEPSAMDEPIKICLERSLDPFAEGWIEHNPSIGIASVPLEQAAIDRIIEPKWFYGISIVDPDYFETRYRNLLISFPILSGLDPTLHTRNLRVLSHFPIYEINRSSCLENRLASPELSDDEYQYITTEKCLSEWLSQSLWYEPELDMLQTSTAVLTASPEVMAVAYRRLPEELQNE